MPVNYILVMHFLCGISLYLKIIKWMHYLIIHQCKRCHFQLFSNASHGEPINPLENISTSRWTFTINTICQHCVCVWYKGNNLNRPRVCRRPNFISNWSIFILCITFANLSKCFLRMLQKWYSCTLNHACVQFARLCSLFIYFHCSGLDCCCMIYKHKHVLFHFRPTRRYPRPAILLLWTFRFIYTIPQGVQ